MGSIEEYTNIERDLRRFKIDGKSCCFDFI